MKRPLKHYFRHLAHATISTICLALIQPSAFAQVAETGQQPVLGNADSLIGDNMSIGYGDGIGGALFPDSTWDEIVQKFNDSSKPKTYDYLTISTGTLELEGYPQPEQKFLVRFRFWVNHLRQEQTLSNSII